MAKEQKLKIPEEKLEALGLNVEQLKKDSENWEALENGRKTHLLNLKGNCNEKTIYFAAKVHLWQDENGNVHPYLHTVKSDISLRAYKDKGHEFTKQEIAMLYSEEGIIKHPVILKFGDKKVPCLVGVDKDTKEVVHIPTKNIYIPEMLMGAKVTKEQQDLIRNGGQVFFPELIRKDGTKFSSVVSFSFLRNNGEGGLVFKTPTPKLLQQQRIDTGKSEGKVEMTHQKEEKIQKVKKEPSEKKTEKRKNGPKM